LRPLSGESCERIKRDDALRDVREIGHYGTGNLEIRIESDGDFERTQDLIVASYERS
jgi:predicted transport protein